MFGLDRDIRSTKLWIFRERKNTLFYPDDDNVSMTVIEYATSSVEVPMTQAELDALIADVIIDPSRIISALRGSDTASADATCVGSDLNVRATYDEILMSQSSMMTILNHHLSIATRETSHLQQLLLWAMIYSSFITVLTWLG
jgi:hypothetical protein